jgi:U3 small nucleolar RNA-associated protein 20
LSPLLTSLIALTAPSAIHAANPRLLQRVYDVLGALFRDLAKPILASEGKGGMLDVWEIVRRGLGAPARPKMAGEEEEEQHGMVLDEAELSARTNGDDEDEQIALREDDESEEPIASTSTVHEVTSAVEITERAFVLPPNLRTTPQTRRLLGSTFAFLVRKARPSSDEEGELEQLYRLMLEDIYEVELLDDGVRSTKGGRGAKGRGKGAGKGRGQEEGSSVLLAEGVTWVTSESCCVSFVFSEEAKGGSLCRGLSVLTIPFYRLPTITCTPGHPPSSAPC